MFNKIICNTERVQPCVTNNVYSFINKIFKKKCVILYSAVNSNLENLKKLCVCVCVCCLLYTSRCV